eukprot:6317988-Prymnesium_polylepis.1
MAGRYRSCAGCLCSSAGSCCYSSSVQATSLAPRMLRRWRVVQYSQSHPLTLVHGKSWVFGPDSIHL